MSDNNQIFLSYSRNDLQAVASLRAQLEQGGLSVFKDDQSIREGDQWLTRLQEAVDGCGGFVVLVGRDGVSRWIGAETQTALIRYFGPHDDAKRLPIFPILLGDTAPESLPAFLRLFQATAWNGTDRLPESLLEQIRARAIVVSEEAVFKGCPFVGLDAFKIDQARLFFGRQKETLAALACFETRNDRKAVRWLEINGNSGCGKSSLMNAGLLPLVEQGWLWPRTRIAQWLRIGPMMPGQRPVAMLAESLARFSREALHEPQEMADVRRALVQDDRALAEWLRGRKRDDTAFLLALDQFEELFTFADKGERQQFDRLLAAALGDADCPLYLISTVRADFLDRFDDLPCLIELRNRLAYPWTLPLAGDDAVRAIIGGPARLAGLDVSEVQEAMVADAHGESGALPLVENALEWLWKKPDGNRLSGRKYMDQGRLAGILSGSADALLRALDPKRQKRALELLFNLVKLDPESRQHTRRRMPREEAEAIAGGGDQGRDLVDLLSGRRDLDGGARTGPMRVITVTEEAAAANDAAGHLNKGKVSWVSLIHETLIRSKGLDDKGEPQPYWPTLWSYIEANKDRAWRYEELRLRARQWQDRKGFARLFGLAGWSRLLGYRVLAAPGSIERRYLRWSAASVLIQALLFAAVVGFLAESVYWARAHGLPLEANGTRWAYKLGVKSLPFPELVKIPAGTFAMGSERKDERPVHSVTITDPFYLAATEVTFAEYDAYWEATGRAKPSDEGWAERARSPVINVDWNDARLYANWLDAMTGAGCRLPSEAEWEYAARAGTTTEYALPAPEGSDDIAGKGLANCRGCGGEWDGKQTAPVRSFKANAWGLYDMHGNVYEWVEDCWHDGYADAPDDGRAWEDKSRECSIRVVRGGSWLSDPGGARSALRGRYYPSYRFDYIGFRVLCSSPIVGH